MCLAKNPIATGLRGLFGGKRRLSTATPAASTNAPPPPTLLGAADLARTMNPTDVLPSTLLSGAEFDATQRKNAASNAAVAAGAAEDAAALRAKKPKTTLLS